MCKYGLAGFYMYIYNKASYFNNSVRFIMPSIIIINKLNKIAAL